MFSGLTFGIRQPTDVLLPKKVPTLSISLVASLSLCAGLMLHGIFSPSSLLCGSHYFADTPSQKNRGMERYINRKITGNI